MADPGSVRDSGPLRCGYYLAGHEVHWIQGLKAANDLDQAAVPALLVSVSDDGALVVDAQGETLSLWNHEPHRLRLLAGRNGGAVSLQMRWSILWTPSATGRYGFSVCDRARAYWKPCPSEPPAGEWFELASEAGGFSLPVGARRPKP